MAYDPNALQIEAVNDKFTLRITMPNGKIQVMQFVNLQSLNNFHRDFYKSIRHRKLGR